jgi:hypothetical protein
LMAGVHMHVTVAFENCMNNPAQSMLTQLS